MKSFSLLTAVAVFCVLAFVSCDDKPSDAQIRQQISRHYSGSATWAEAGISLVDEIQILRLERIEQGEESGPNQEQWLVEAQLKGSYGDVSNATDGTSPTFDDRVRFRFQKNAHGVWVGQEVPKYLW